MRTREPLRRIESVVLPLARANVDTDQIVPARYLQKPYADDFGPYLFRDLRADAQGMPRAEFVLNEPAYAGARIVVARHNFGCGSSREHAVWALYDHGVRVVIAPSFGDIFFNNALKNGLLPIVLTADAAEALLQAALARPGARAAVDLEQQTVRGPDVQVHRFAIDGFARDCLLAGQDELDYTMALAGLITDYEQRHHITTGRG